MPHPLHQKLTGLLAEATHRADPVPRELADVCLQLLELIELNRADLTESFEVQGRTDQRLNAIEQHPALSIPPIGRQGA